MGESGWRLVGDTDRLSPMSGRFVIYGAGAIGGVIGGSLALHGHPTALIARGAHLEALQTQGLTLQLPEDVHQIEVPAAGGPDELDLTADDIVILAMKTQDTEDALDALAAAAPPGIAVVCAQNGVDNERMALRRFERVYGLCVYLPGVHLEPGVVEGAGTPVLGILDVGRYPTGVDETAAHIAAALTDSRFRSRPDAGIMRYKYAKLRVNTGNALDAACGRSSRGSELTKRAAAEALTVFRAAGIDVATRDEEAERRGDMRTVSVEGRARAGSSSWQSLARGAGRIEADYLNGEVVLLGRLHGVPTPVNEAFRRIANRMAAERMAPGSMEMGEVEALVADLER